MVCNFLNSFGKFREQIVNYAISCTFVFRLGLLVKVR